MGVDCNVYTVWGVKHDGYDSVFSDAVMEMPDAPLERYVIADGMSGEFIVVGAILYDSGEINHGGADGFETLDVSDLAGKRDEVFDAFQKHAPEWAHKLAGEWKLMAFAHYS